MSDQKSNPGSLVEALTVVGNKLTGAVLAQNSSVAKLSAELTVNPICFVDSRLNHLPETYDIVSGALTFFGGCYVSAALLLSNKRITNAMATIDRLNPSRRTDWGRLADGVAKSNLIQKASGESQDYTINLFSKEELSSINTFISAEAVGPSDNGKKLEESLPLSLGKRIYINVEGDTYQTANDNWRPLERKSGLSVPEQNEWDAANAANEKKRFSEKKDAYTLPINIHYSSYVMSSGLMVDFVSLLGMDKRLFSTIRSWRNGVINLGELATMDHVVRAKKKLLLMDNDGRIKEIMNRKRGNFAQSIITDETSLGTVANTLIISERTRIEAEYRLGYRFSNAKARENFMNATSTMILIIVDEETEMATMYVHGQTAGSEIPISEYKKVSKKDNNITDIIRAFSGGNTPGF